MRVIICEDHPIQREFIHKEIVNYAGFHEPGVEVVLRASRPDEVLSYLEYQKADCYFLDIELNHQMDGMALAAEIRKKDPLASIIFITTHADRLKLTFTYKLAALDYIVKDTPDRTASDVKRALQAAFERYVQIGQDTQPDILQITIGERIRNISLQDIYFIETSSIPHKLSLYEKHGNYEFYGRMKEYEEMAPSFYRCHTSCLINLQHVIEADRRNRTVTMSNGAVCPVSFRAFKELKSRLSE